MTAPDLLVIGASVRAAAWSARGLGRIAAIDQFGDADLRELADVVVSSNYPHDLPDLAARFPACPWFYTGALENHPRIVQAITSQRPLLGNDADVLRLARNPHVVAASLADRDLPCLPVVGESEPVPERGKWLLKPRRSASGRGIQPWSGEPIPAGHYLQRLADGSSFSSVHLAEPAGTECVGATCQLFRERRPFEWSGNVGPIELPTRVRETVARIGEHLARVLGLKGPFGLDFVLDGGTPFLVEVNPRYTASVEVLERATGRRLLGEFLGHIEPSPSPPTSFVLKRVLFARAAIPSTREFGDRRIAPDVEVADVPMPGTPVEVDHPLCTLLVTGPDEATMLARADVVDAAVRRRLGATDV